MKKELPKLRLCIKCGKLFEPTEEQQYMHPECLIKWNEHYREMKAKVDKEKEQNGGI